VRVPSTDFAALFAIPSKVGIVFIMEPLASRMRMIFFEPEEAATYQELSGTGGREGRGWHGTFVWSQA
jgi:hypothetical protein